MKNKKFTFKKYILIISVISLMPNISANNDSLTNLIKPGIFYALGTMGFIQSIRLASRTYTGFKQDTMVELPKIYESKTTGFRGFNDIQNNEPDKPQTTISVTPNVGAGLALTGFLASIASFRIASQFNK